MSATKTLAERLVEQFRSDFGDESGLTIPGAIAAINEARRITWDQALEAAAQLAMRLDKTERSARPATVAMRILALKWADKRGKPSTPAEGPRP